MPFHPILEAYGAWFALAAILGAIQYVMERE
jgi:hypothetical protein